MLNSLFTIFIIKLLVWGNGPTKAISPPWWLHDRDKRTKRCHDLGHKPLKFITNSKWIIVCTSKHSIELVSSTVFKKKSQVEAGIFISKAQCFILNVTLLCYSHIYLTFQDAKNQQDHILYPLHMHPPTGDAVAAALLSMRVWQCSGPVPSGPQGRCFCYLRCVLMRTGRKPSSCTARALRQCVDSKESSDLEPVGLGTRVLIPAV